ncbi:HTH-type transcriptional activator CmpR [Cupriavidus yeoncheonensis]|uniref:HTH-type transcriptional activator CmpR n=1 Tax=Cupriavidus yeoncheonensis TaxID=1462994 RepID=A0A916J1Z2_9BURK|nr:LysR family transcriptional regulator [Cupriavidus yeoncheonensis]CAG2157894.1 HTH-type transcriptional activator CmpR [Cupriavidus yeoncheonensis]
MKIDPVSLRLFLAVSELGTIAAAAEREHIAASAVSKRISDLEDALRTQLLERSNKGIVPTPAGIALQNLSRGIVNDIENIATMMQDYASGTRGLVRIYANVSSIAQFLPMDLHGFIEKYPDVQLQLEERISTAILRGVAENAADIGCFADLGAAPHGVVTLPYREDDLVVVVSRGHRLARRKKLAAPEVLEHYLIGLQTGSYINMQLLRVAGQLGVPVKFRMQVNSYDAVCLMVESDMGIGILPVSLARRYAKTIGISVVGLDAPWAHRKLNLCIRSYEGLPVAARQLVDHLCPTAHAIVAAAGATRALA